MIYSTWREFDFVKQQRNKLLVTIGESWTWGDSLGKTQHRIYDDKKFRLTNVYGGQLAEMMHADFLNIAEPGQTNLWITKHFKMFVDNIAEFQYDEIIVVLSMTEIGREFEGDLDKDRDYMSDLNHVTNLNQFLSMLTNYIYQDIVAVDKSNIKLLVGTNFVDSNYPQELNVLDQTWVDRIADELQQPLIRPCYVVGSWVFDRFNQLLAFAPNYSRQDFINDMLTHMEIAQARTNFLMQSDLNYKKASKHPTPRGHHLWAEYLYSQL